MQRGFSAVHNWLHEGVGLAAYWLTGRSDRLLP
jgi:hypothetical protein